MTATRNTPIYLDYQATTPLDPRVWEAMQPYFMPHFGNPHSVNHAYGWQAETAVDKAREQVAAAIHATPKEIIFTSGATESNNLAIKGVAHYYAGKKRHLITVETEHECVRQSFRQLQQEGWEVTWLPVDPYGLIDLNQLRESIRADTLLVSVMAVNNEIGVIQPLQQIGALCRERGVFFHSDAAQALGKIPINVAQQQIDLLSISGHKLYGPKGIGALYIRRRPRVGIVPLFSGGGQERGIRPGTLPTSLVVGLGEAVERAEAERESESHRLWQLHRQFLETLQQVCPSVQLNGHPTQRIPGNLSLRFPHTDGDALMGALKGLALSSGSACSSASLAPSYVLQALGLDAQEAKTTLRIGLGRMTTAEEAQQAAEQIAQAVHRLQKSSQRKEG